MFLYTEPLKINDVCIAAVCALLIWRWSGYSFHCSDHIWCYYFMIIHEGHVYYIYYFKKYRYVSIGNSKCKITIDTMCMLMNVDNCIIKEFFKTLFILVKYRIINFCSKCMNKKISDLQYILILHLHCMFKYFFFPLPVCVIHHSSYWSENTKWRLRRSLSSWPVKSCVYPGTDAHLGSIHIQRPAKSSSLSSLSLAHSLCFSPSL